MVWTREFSWTSYCALNDDVIIPGTSGKLRTDSDVSCIDQRRVTHAGASQISSTTQPYECFV